MPKLLGAILGWKFGHYPGIVTREDVLTDWPEDLGPVPTDNQIQGYEREYLASPDFVDPYITGGS